MEAHLTGNSGDIDEGVAAAVATLDSLARRHYPERERDGLASLLADVETPLGRRQFSRLLGVIVKEPFAIERVRPPSKSTHAVLALDWKDDNVLAEGRRLYRLRTRR
jgi:hypothetical protein